MQPSRLPKFYSVRELADHLGVSQRTIQRRIEEGRLRHHRIGRQIRVSEDDAVNYVEQERR